MLARCSHCRELCIVQQISHWRMKLDVENQSHVDWFQWWGNVSSFFFFFASFLKAFQNCFHHGKGQRASCEVFHNKKFLPALSAYWFRIGSQKLLYVPWVFDHACSIQYRYVFCLTTLGVIQAVSLSRQITHYLIRDVFWKYVNNCVCEYKGHLVGR